MLLKSLKIKNMLSFGLDTPALELKPLNILIGSNGIGKSNFIEAVGLLQAAPKDIALPLRGSGVQDWLWKGDSMWPRNVATVEAIVENLEGKQPLRYRFSFTESGKRFEIVDERIENELPYKNNSEPYLYYGFENGHPVINLRSLPEKAMEKLSPAARLVAISAAKVLTRNLKRDAINPGKSILNQRRDPDLYPEITYMGDIFEKILILNEWTFGRRSPARQAQKADASNIIWEADCSNLGMILSRLRRVPKAKKAIIEHLRELCGRFDDFDVSVEGNFVQVLLTDGDYTIPATRLSDGTARYLCLLAALCDPNPPPLVCIEEPELGLHPDILPTIAKLLKEASERTQLIVTTHSEILVDCFSDTPESVVVCEKEDGGTVMKRLSTEELTAWLKTYSLGQLWSRGEIGGNRW
ncbi:MAG: AAA family ATPase [Lentisphaeria bacterium]